MQWSQSQVQWRACEWRIRVRIRHWLAVVIAVRFRVLTAFGLLLHVFLFPCTVVAAFISSAGERHYLIGHRDKLL